MSRCLIVDDNTSISTMLSEIIETEGHETIIANDGKTAIGLIESQKFDFIVLDIEMPEFSGLDVIDHLENNGKLKENKIIVMTAWVLSEQKVKDLKERGIQEVLKKPDDITTLMSIINS